MSHMMRRSEFPEVSWLRRELDRLTGVLRPFDQHEHDAMSPWAPAVDVAEDEKAITIKVDLPEVEKKDIHVSIQNGALTIHGERRRENEEKKKNFHRIERSFGVYERSFSLPESVEREKVAAECRNGVLTITLPKRAEPAATPSQIEVQ